MSTVNSTAVLAKTEGIKTLKGRLMKFDFGLDWEIPKQFKGGKVCHIGNVIFFQEKNRLHTSNQLVSRIQVDLFHDLEIVPYYHFKDALLTYISHIDGPTIDWPEHKSSYAYWVHAVNPADGKFFFLMIDCDPASRTSTG